MSNSPILAALARAYESSRAGRTGTASLDFQTPVEKILSSADATTGQSYELALRDLRAAAMAGALQLEHHRHDPNLLIKVRIPAALESSFHSHLGRPTPAELRRVLADAILALATLPVPAEWQKAWPAFCESTAGRTLNGESIAPLDRGDPDRTLTLLNASARLLSWTGESYQRFASCVLFNDSKKLETLRPAIETLLAHITDNAIASLETLGITPTGGGCWIHGPATLEPPAGPIALAALRLPVHLSAADLLASRITTSARRWILVENETMLHELAKLRSGHLLLSSGFRGGYPNKAVITLLQNAPTVAELLHFGDSDPQGFEILANLRARTGRAIASLHMNHRPHPGSPLLTQHESRLALRLLDSSHLTMDEKSTLLAIHSNGRKGLFEQESLGLPHIDPVTRLPAFQ